MIQHQNASFIASDCNWVQVVIESSREMGHHDTTFISFIASECNVNVV